MTGLSLPRIERTIEPDTGVFNERFLSWPQVRNRVGLSRTTVWRRVRQGMFPAPVKISVGRVAWRESDLQAWMRARTGGGHFGKMSEGNVR